MKIKSALSETYPDKINVFDMILTQNKGMQRINFRKVQPGKTFFEFLPFFSLQIGVYQIQYPDMFFKQSRIKKEKTVIGPQGIQ